MKNKKKGLHSNLVRFLAKKFAHRFYAQTFCPSYKGGGGGGGGRHATICILFYPGDPKGGPWPPLNTPLFLAVSNIHSKFFLGYLCFLTKISSFRTACMTRGVGDPQFKFSNLFNKHFSQLFYKNFFFVKTGEVEVDCYLNWYNRWLLIMLLHEVY